MRVFIFVASYLALLGSVASRAETGTTIVAAYAKETVVRGTAAVGSGPIKIVNVHFPARATIGTGQVSGDGTFGISIKTPLVVGHRIVAIDAGGRTSPVFVVSPARSGDTPAPPR